MKMACIDQFIFQSVVLSKKSCLPQVKSEVPIDLLIVLQIVSAGFVFEVKLFLLICTGLLRLALYIKRNEFKLKKDSLFKIFLVKIN